MKLRAQLGWFIQDVQFLSHKLRGRDYHIGDPSLDAETLGSLEEDMAKAKGYLEYGSGGSTILASRLVNGAITTVESDREYLEAVRARLLGVEQSRLNLIHANIGTTSAWGKPLLPWRSTRWANYPEAPWKHIRYVPDLILIDGRFRLACALMCVLKLPQGWQGVIYIDDYMGREEYATIRKYAKEFMTIGRAVKFNIIPVFDVEECRKDYTSALSIWL
ncbi:MAG: hypothetical protein ACK4U0_15170 [Mesorhizobium sp.]